jgi:hypothetical protein
MRHTQRRENTYVPQFRLYLEQSLPQILRGLHVGKDGGDEAGISSLINFWKVRKQYDFIYAKNGCCSANQTYFHGFFSQMGGIRN